MSNDILVEVSCPSCQNAIDVREHGRHVVCDACNSHFLLRGRLCPSCSTYNQQDEAICGSCGRPLTRVCRKCQIENWSGDEYCVRCGSVLDILDVLANSQAEALAQRRAKHHAKIPAIKAEIEEASNARMQTLLAQEQERRTKLSARRQTQRNREIVAVSLVLMVILLFAIYVLLSS